MRDLKADLEHISQVSKPGELEEYDAWMEAIERAIAAEAELERLKKHLGWATGVVERDYSCKNCKNLIESEHTNKLFCSYHSEREYQHEVFLDDYCNYFEVKREG